MNAVNIHIPTIQFKENNKTCININVACVTLKQLMSFLAHSESQNPEFYMCCPPLFFTNFYLFP